MRLDVLPRGRPGVDGHRRWLSTAAPTVVVLVLELASVSQVSALRVHLALALVAAGSLLWRHRAPWVVLGITAVAPAVQVLLGAPQTNTILAQWVAVAAVVRVLSWPRSLLPPTVAVGFTTGVSLLTSPAGGVPDFLMNVISAVVAWSFGEAQARRVAARERMAAEIAALQASSGLRSRYEALSERLRISDETGRLLGATLDAVLAQVRASRSLLGTTAGSEHLAAVEDEGRRALAHLDRYLELLRVPQDRPEPPEGPSTRVAPRGPWWSTRGARIAVAAGPVVPLLVIALWEYPVLVPAGPTAVTVGLTIVQVTPLLARSRWPLGVALVISAALLLQLSLGHPVHNATLALPLALHSLAEREGRRRCTVLAAGVVAALGVPAFAVDVAYAAGFVTILAVVCAVAVYTGDSVRLLRAQDEQLHTRLVRTEHDERLRVRSAVSEERLAAAQDLHDSVGHVLSLVTLQAGAARMAAQRAPERARQALDAVERAALAALSELDDRVRDAPSDGSDPRVRTLEDLREIAEHVRAAGVSVVLRLDAAAVRLPPLLETTAYRIVQEALTNAVKHAPGSAAVATVSVTSARLEITVVNTAGRSPGTTAGLPSGRRGLHGMRERASLFAGELHAGPQPDGGFRVHLSLPIADVPPQRRAHDASDSTAPAAGAARQPSEHPHL